MRWDLSQVSDSSLLLLADILPTGVFAAMQALQHPKISPMLTGKPYPYGGFTPNGPIAQGQASTQVQAHDRTLTIGIIGLGPVGVVSILCICVRSALIQVSLHAVRGRELA